MLVVSDLRVAYGRIEVVHGISFEAKAGEVTCLIGPNGAGKTTTISMLLGLLLMVSFVVTVSRDHSDFPSSSSPTPRE